MTDAGPLTGVQVLVTRPAEQAEHLCSLITAAGGEPVRFPVLAIEPVQTPPPDLTNYDWLIFISANAVLNFCQQFAQPLPAEVKVAAIGRKTAALLEQRGMPASLVPPRPYTSEVLLQQAELADVTGQRILIVRGVGGREQLRANLQQRGAEVDYYEVYRRVRPSVDPASLLARWRKGDVDLVTLSSNEGLENLLALLGEDGLALLRRTPLLPVSERMATLAREHGLLLTSGQADNATDEAVLAALIEWAQQRLPDN